MELIGFILAIPATGFVSLIYVSIATFLINRLKWLRWPLLAASLIIAGNFLAEIFLLITIGAKQAYSLWGIFFTLIHEINFFLSPAAAANFLIVALAFAAPKNDTKWPAWTGGLILGTLVCWLMCMVVLIGNISIDEAIVGVNADRPFWMSPSR